MPPLLLAMPTVLLLLLLAMPTVMMTGLGLVVAAHASGGLAAARARSPQEVSTACT